MKYSTYTKEDDKLSFVLTKETDRLQYTPRPIAWMHTLFLFSLFVSVFVLSLFMLMTLACYMRLDKKQSI